jgi:hypothetical protein
MIEPLTQIVGGVGLLLAGVLNLLGNLLSGLGLDSLLKGIVAATVCCTFTRSLFHTIDADAIGRA